MARNFESHFLTRIPQIGRPKKFQSVEELEAMIQDYFESCFSPVTEKKSVLEPYRDEETGEMLSRRVTVDVEKKDNSGQQIYEQVKPFTVSGLALHIGVDRDTLLNYEKNPGNEKFFGTIKRAKAVIQNFVEARLYAPTQVTGAIFALKNNHGWVDRTETDLTTKGEKINPVAIENKVKGMFESPIERPALDSPVPDSVKEDHDS